jgi:hypothetical protein
VASEHPQVGSDKKNWSHHGSDKKNWSHHGSDKKNWSHHVSDKKTGVTTFQNCVRQTRPPFKMAAVTKNRNFFNCPIYCSYMEMSSLTHTPGLSVKFFFQPIMQIRHILIKDHI